MAIAIQMKDVNYALKIVLVPVLLNPLYVVMDNVTMVKRVLIAAKTVEYVKPSAAIKLAIPGKIVRPALMIVVFVPL